MRSAALVYAETRGPHALRKKKNETARREKASLPHGEQKGETASKPPAICAAVVRTHVDVFDQGPRQTADDWRVVPLTDDCSNLLHRLLPDKVARNRGGKIRREPSKVRKRNVDVRVRFYAATTGASLMYQLRQMVVDVPLAWAWYRSTWGNTNGAVTSC